MKKRECLLGPQPCSPSQPLPQDGLCETRSVLTCSPDIRSRRPSRTQAQFYLVPMPSVVFITQQTEMSESLQTSACLFSRFLISLLSRSLTGIVCPLMCSRPWPAGSGNGAPSGLHPRAPRAAPVPRGESRAHQLEAGARLPQPETPREVANRAASRLYGELRSPHVILIGSFT